MLDATSEYILNVNNRYLHILSTKKITTMTNPHPPRLSASATELYSPKCVAVWSDTNESHKGIPIHCTLAPVAKKQVSATD